MTIKVVAYAVVVRCLHSLTHSRRLVPWPQYVSADCPTQLRCSYSSLHSSTSLLVGHGVASLLWAPSCYQKFYSNKLMSTTNTTCHALCAPPHFGKSTISDHHQKYTYLFPFHAKRARVRVRVVVRFGSFSPTFCGFIAFSPPGQFAPRSESANGTLAHSHHGTFAPWPFCSLALSLPGLLAPWNFRSPERNGPGTFIPWNFRTQEYSLPGTFAPWNFRSLFVGACHYL